MSVDSRFFAVSLCSYLFTLGTSYLYMVGVLWSYIFSPNSISIIHPVLHYNDNHDNQQ